MNIVSAENIGKAYGEKQLFARLSFGVEEGERIGLIGVNGSGKSTLLQVIAGLVAPDEGAVTARGGLSIEYLAQSPELDQKATVLDAVFRGQSPAMRLLRDYEEAMAASSLHPEDPGAQSRLAGLNVQMDAHQVWSLEAQAKTILTRLGIGDFSQSVAALSGGQRKRVALARALIHPADLLILDEPTNHIDNDTVAWLEGYLSKFTDALLLVTHDRYFLDRVANRILELDRGILYSYHGNYGDFLEQKAAREEAEAAQEQKRQNLLRRELAWLRRGAKARTTKQKARIQRAEGLKAADPGQKEGTVDIAVRAHRLGRRIIEIQTVTKRFDGRTLIQDFSYTVLPGDRVGIIGPNGSGKSTLLNLIAGRLTPDSGSVIRGETVRLAYYDQESEGLDPDQLVIDYIREVAEVVEMPDGGTITAAQMLERFLFPGRVQWTPIGKLSGGERRRLYLLRTLMQEPNVLLLDEPTNDLDIQTLTILEDYLDHFPGVVIAVSHDRYFLDRVVDHLFAFEGDRIRSYVGSYTDYMEARAEDDASAPAPKQQSKPPEPKAEVDARRALKFTFKEQREFDLIEGVIAGLEAELAGLSKAMDEAAADYQRLQTVATEHARVEAELNRTLDRWAELTERAEAMDQSKGR